MDQDSSPSGSSKEDAPPQCRDERGASAGTARRRRLLSLLRELPRDERGVILPYVTGLLTVIVGVSVLALDGARFESLQTQLQKGADSLALAGAAELNRLPDSITRATAAINATGSATLVSNSSYFGTGASANVTVSSICFLSSLPPGATTSLGTCLTNTADHAVTARFVQVVVSPVTINTILPASFFGGANNVTTQAQAVAGNDTALCGTVPMFTCNPYETAGMTYAQATQALINGASSATSQRTLIQLQGTQGNNGQYFPGNFGYLQPNTGSLSSGTCGPGGSGVVQAMALSTVNACTTQNSVSTQTGNDSNVFEALDVRFDLWKAHTGSFQRCSTDSNYAPDVNVRKGYTPGNGNNGACNAQQNNNPSGAWPPGPTGSYSNNSNSTAIALPLDNNMMANGTINTATTQGNGNWTCGDLTAATNGAPTNCTTGKGKNAKTTCTTLPLASTAGISVGMSLSGTNVPANSIATGVSTSSVTVGASNGNAADVSSVTSGTNITFPGYWSTAHAGDATALANPPTGCAAPATTSRYSVYQYEINQGYSADVAGGHAGGEKGSGAMCSTTTPVSGRRILHVAILNCLSLAIQGHATNVPVAAYAKMFLTVPVDSPVTDPYVEMTGLDTPGDGFQFQSVQLYR